MYGHGYSLNLRKSGRVLNVSSKGTLFFTKSTDTKAFMKLENYHPNSFARDLLKFQLHLHLKAWAGVLVSNLFVEIEAQEILPIIVGHMLYCIKTNTLFNLSCFIARRFGDLDYNNETFPYARVMTAPFEYLKNKHPNDAYRMTEVGEVTPIDPRLGTKGSNDLGRACMKISTFNLYKDIYLQMKYQDPAFFDLTKGEEGKQRAKAYGGEEKLLKLLGKDEVQASSYYKAKIKTQATSTTFFIFAINLFPPLDNPELTIRRRSCTDPTLLNDTEMAAEGNDDLPQSLNGRGGHIDPIAMQAMNIGLRNDMIQQILEKDLVTHFQDFQNTFESSDDSTNIVNAPREPFVIKQDHGSFVDKIICDLNKAPDSPHLHTFSPNQFHCFHYKDVLGDGEVCQRCTCTRCGSGLSKGLYYICGNNQNSLNDSPSISKNSSQNPPHIDECCYECGDALDGIFCQRCTCKSYGKGAHIGYNCPPKVPIISNPEPCNQTINNEPPQTLPSFDPTCYSKKDNSLPCVSKPNFVDESPNVFNPPPQPPIYSCEFCGSNAQNGNYCTPQVPFIYPKPGYTRFVSRKLLDDLQNIHEELAEYINSPGWNRPAFYDDDDDDDVDYTIAITPVLSTEEPDNSLSMGDEHLDTIPATESDKVIKSSVEDLVPIPSEFKGIPDTMCDVHLVNNPTPLEAKYHFEIVINSNDDYSSSDDDSLFYENVEYVEASPHDSELVSLEVEKIVIPEDEEIEDDNLREKLLNVNRLITKIKALKDNSTPSFEFLTKSSSTSPKSVLEETNTFDDSLPEFENFSFDLEEISSGSTTTHSDISLLNYEAFSFYDDHIEEISSGSTTTHSDISLLNYEAFSFYDDHIEEISSGSTTTHSDISLSEYDSFIFDLSHDQFTPTDRSDSTHEEFADELAHIISLSEYDCFYFGNLPDPGEWISSLNSEIRENLSSITRVKLSVEDDYSPLLAYVVLIFLAYLTYPVIPLHLHSFRNEDTIFDSGITINRFYSFKPGLSHRCGTVKKFNTHQIPYGESKVHIEVLSVLSGNRLSIQTVRDCCL
nr:hypothetical protein [Tanacetum cinerariifolium]